MGPLGPHRAHGGRPPHGALWGPIGPYGALCGPYVGTTLPGELGICMRLLGILVLYQASTALLWAFTRTLFELGLYKATTRSPPPSVWTFFTRPLLSLHKPEGYTDKMCGRAADSMVRGKPGDNKSHLSHKSHTIALQHCDRTTLA